MAEKKRGPGRPKGSKNKRKTGDETVAMKSQGGSSTKKVERKTSSKGKTSKKAQEKNTAKETTSKKDSSKKKEDSKNNVPERDVTYVDSAVKQSIVALVLLAIGVFLVISIQTNLTGIVGNAIGGFFKGLFGLGGCILPYIMIIYGILMFLKIAAPFRGRTVVLITIFFLMIDLINAGRFVSEMKYGILGIKNVYAEGIALKNGGVFGMYAGCGLQQLIGVVGLYMVSGLVALICVLLLVNTPMSRFVEAARTRRIEKRLRKEEKQNVREGVDRNIDTKEQQLNIDIPNVDGNQDNGPLKEGTPKKSFGFREGFKKKNDSQDPYKLSKDFLLNKDDSNNAVNESENLRDKVSENASNAGTGNTGEKTKSAIDEKALEGLPENKKNIIKLVKSEDAFGKDALNKKSVGGPNIQIGNDTAETQPEPEEFEGFVKDSKVIKNRKPEPKKDDEFVGFKTDAGHVPGGFAGSDTFVKKTDDNGVIPTEQKESDKSKQYGGFSKGLAGAAGVAGATGAVIGGASVATAKSKTESSDSAVKVTPKATGRYKLPPLDLLNPIKAPVKSTGLKEDLTERASLLEQTLSSFNVEAKVVNVISGPSVTRYEIEPARGVKVQSITRLADDIALNMMAKSIRIEAPIPGKAAVGIEIENESRQMVGFREIVGSAEFRNHKSKLAFSVGRDIGGKPIVADLGKMPHLLIAGATGSGKSVCINTVIGSILYKARPEEVKLVLIDPKMVELGNYNGIPHLLIPVVTDSTKAAAALNWAVSEMTERYKKFAKTGVREIGAYNKIKKDQGEKEEILPQIVVIIDELADLMMVASSQVEDAICRLAQLARAAGMHLVIATQRPSVDVITGLIKANVPSRIAFMVSSQIDSRTIIDMPGAEKLVGNGDMLFKPQDLNKPKRIQGPFIDDNEVERLIDYVKQQSGEPEYNEEVIEHIEKGNSYNGDDEGDELMMEAIETVVSAGQASVSMLQRRFRIGYNRAARIIDMMESRGIIGPQDGSRPRQVLMTDIELEQMKEEL